MPRAFARTAAYTPYVKRKSGSMIHDYLVRQSSNAL